MRSIILCENRNNVDRVFSAEQMKKLENIAGLDRRIYTLEELRSLHGELADVEYIFSTWGMPHVDEEEVGSLLPSLKCVFYAAGTVQGFARPFLKNGVRVFSAWAANAVPVAEYTVAQIILANKGFFVSSRLMSSGDHAAAVNRFGKYPGNFGETVGIIGAGMIGKLVIRLLKSYNLKVLVFDPFLPDAAAAELGVEKCDLPTLFKRSFVISNHLANNAQTQGILNYELFCSMRENSVFLNTGRGAQVVEQELVRVLRERPDITAVLDVTHPEPPEPEHDFYKLDNCVLTPHIAGSSGNEVHRMTEYMIEEFERCVRGENSLYEVTEKMLETMA